MSKVTFLNVPTETGKVPERTYGCSYVLYPTPNLAVLYSAAVLRKDHDVSIKDFARQDYEEFTDWLETDDSDYYIFDSVLLSTKPDIKAAKHILKKKKNAKIIFFGPHPTYIPDKFLLDKRTIIARGETEFIIQKIVDGKPLKDILGVSWFDGKKKIHNKTAGIIEDVDSIPYPARDLDPNKEFYNPKLASKKFTNMLGSRGCSYQCYYCVPMSISWAREIEWRRNNNNQKPPVTKRSAKNILGELRELSKAGYKELSFIDDMFMFGDDRILELMKGMKGMDFEFGILARADHLQKPELVKALAEAGCQYVDMGVESFDQKALNYAKKGLKVETVDKAIDLLNKYGVEPKLNILLGMAPHETEESINRTIEKTKKLPVSYAMFSICTPFPGTGFEKKAQEEGWQIFKGDSVYENLDPAKRSLIKLPHLTPQKLEKLAKKANRQFYLRPKQVVKQFSKTKSLKSVTQTVKSGIRLLK